mgnify:CR=1 FL=1
MDYNVVYAQMGRGKTERIVSQALAGVRQYVSIYFYAGHHCLHHVYYGDHRVKCRQEILLYELKVAEITRRQIVGDERYLIRECLKFMGRGKTERIVSQALAGIASTIGKLAYDACMFNSQNFGFIKRGWSRHRLREVP